MKGKTIKARKETRHINLHMSDYKKILKFYKLSIPKTRKALIKKGQNEIDKHFCSCIKKVHNKFIKGTPRSIAIAICTKSVVTRKGYKRGKFNCKKRRSVKIYRANK
jgi:glycerate-2-kinase